MKIIFFGTPYYVLPILKAVHKEFVTGPGKSPFVAVVTQPPRPVGRKQILSYSPIDKWAHERNIPTFYKSKEILSQNLEPDLGILASYGEIISQEVIDLFPKGILVVHPSLLPKYRGSSPVPAAMINGDEKTGVTIFRMDAKLDHGPIVSQFKEDILATDTGDTLRDKLFERSAQVLVELLKPYLKNKITAKTQDDSQATFTKMLTRESGYIDLTKEEPIYTERFIRAMQDWPGAWTLLRLPATEGQAQVKRLKLLKAHLENEKLVLDEVQLEGKGPVSWKQFMEGHRDATFTAG